MEIDYEQLEKAKLVFNEFFIKPGSDHIATVGSLANILNLVQNNSFKLVVEIGSGIGTISKLILQNTSTKFLAFESNKWCIENLQMNTRDCRDFQIITDFEKLLSKLESHFFLIIDDYLTWKHVWKLMKSNHAPSAIFIEGYRNKQVGMISFLLMLNSKKANYCRSNIHEITLETKSGSYFVSIKNTSFLQALLSWLKRLKKTNEAFELVLATYFQISKTIRLRSRIKLFIENFFVSSK